MRLSRLVLVGSTVRRMEVLQKWYNNQLCIVVVLCYPILALNCNMRNGKESSKTIHVPWSLRVKSMT
jgi:hypothetical protein